MPEHEFFTPENIDEQVAGLLPESASRKPQTEAVSQPEGRLVKDLQGYYRAELQQDLASLERAWQQVSRHLDTSQAHLEAMDKLSPTKILRSPHERTQSMFRHVSERPREGKFSRRLSLLAAALIAAMLVGGMAVIFKLAHQVNTAHQQKTNTASSGSTVPTLQNVPSSPGLYLITLADKAQNYQVTKVDKNTGSVLWNHFIGVSESSAIVADNLVFGSSGDPNAYGGANAPDDHSYVYALNAKTGTQIWRTDLGADYLVTNASPPSIQGTPMPPQGYNLGVLGTPTFADGVVYVTSAAGKVYALNAASGAILWTYNAHAIDYDLSSNTAYFVQTLAVANGLVYGATLNKLYALDARTGHEVWSALASARSMFGSPTVTGGRVYLSIDPLSTHTENSAKSHIVAYSADHGAKLWQSDGYYWAGFLNDAPVVANGLVYVANVYTGIYALDAQTGHTRWQHVLGTDAFNNPDGCSWPVVASGVVYTNCGASGHPTLNAYNAANGTVIWSRASSADPADIDHGTLYATAFPGLVYFVKTSDGATTFHRTYGLVTKDKFGNPSAPEPLLTLVP